ncbi:MAG: ribosome maturation factor RimM [Pseudomonadota bacterium]
MTKKPTTPSTLPARGDASDTDREVLMGYIASAHGIRGEVVIKSFTDEPANIATYDPIIAREKRTGQRRSVSIKRCRETGKGLVAQLAGVADRNAAEALRGYELWVARANLPEPEDGAFYYEDLIGMTAVAADGTPFGHVTAVENYGAGDLLDIDLMDQPGSELVPFTHAHVPDVRLSDRTVVVNWPLAFEIAAEPDAGSAD